MLIVGNALQRTPEGLALHPDLAFLERRLCNRRRRWFACADRTVPGWHAALCGAPLSVMLAHRAGLAPDAARQVWVASPWSGQVGRDSIHVMPDGLMPWSDRDAEWLCDALSSLLAAEGMRLVRTGAALVLACEAPLDAQPADFAIVAGGRLPNRHPPGADGGRLMRLAAEIQMLLHGRQPDWRKEQPAVHGLWFWDGAAWPAPAPARTAPVRGVHPFLPVESRACAGASLMLADAECVQDMLEPDRLPDAVVLAGAGHALALNGWRPAWPGRGRLIPGESPRKAAGEAELMRWLKARL